MLSSDCLGEFIISDRQLDNTTVQFLDNYANPNVIVTAKYNDVLKSCINIEYSDSDPEQLVIDMNAYDNNNKQVDFNGKAHVKVRLDDNFLPDKRENLKVFRYDGNGISTEIDAVIEKDNYIVFDTEGLGYGYFNVGMSASNPTVTLEDGSSGVSVSGYKDYFRGVALVTAIGKMTVSSLEYEIKLLDGESSCVQPGGPVEVTLPIPKQMQGRKIDLKAFSERYPYTTDVRHEDNALIFTTNHIDSFEFTIDESSTIVNSETNVSVSGTLPDNAVIETKQPTQTSDQLTYEVVLKDKDGGGIIQLTSKVKVSLPIPESFTNPHPEEIGLYGFLSAGLDFEVKADSKTVSDLKVFRDEGNGKYINMNASYENNAMEFETDKLGTFVITERQLSNGGLSTPSETPTPPSAPSYPLYPDSGWMVPSSTTTTTVAATTSVTAAVPTVTTAESTQATGSEPTVTVLSSTNSTTVPPSDVLSETVPFDNGLPDTYGASGSTEETDNDKNISTGLALSAVPVLISACALVLSRKKKK